MQMKSIPKQSKISSLFISQGWEELKEIALQWRQHKLPVYLFLAISFNLVVAPIVYGATGEQISRPQAWALGLLGLVTLALSIYLLFVMFIPEKF